tara:strand:+ start:833 stop:1177 length:345 start_codon:yes stop_codon:yes gene_type:complete
VTLQNLIDRIDWSHMDASRDAWLAKLPEESRTLEVSDEWESHRDILVTGALYASKCELCGEKVSYCGPEAACPMCGGDFKDDWDGRMAARRMLGPAWKQVIEILKEENLIENGR